MKDSLKKRTIHALSWSFIESIGMQAVQFFIGLILARLLFPAQFGLIGMLTIFMAVAQTFIYSGFGEALIQKRDINQNDICSVFYFNIAVGIIFAGLLCLAAPWIASFYKQPELTMLTRALSLTIVINSFGLIQNILVSKEINFKTLTKVNLAASLLSGIIGVSMAFSGYGVWSLAFQQIFRSLFATTLLWIFNKWRPSLVFDFQSLRQMFKFGSPLLASGLLDQFFRNIYLLAIGKLFSATDLGYFTRASNLQEFPSMTLSGMVGRVTFPVFSAIQDDREWLKRGMKKALTSLAFINFPMMIGISLIAHPLIIILFSEKWIESVPYLRLLCFSGFLLPLHVVNLNMLQAQGRSDLFFRLEIIKKILDVAGILITWRWGISAIIVGMLVNSVIGYYLNSYYSKKLIGYGIIEQLFDLFPYISVSILMGVAVYLTGLLQFPNDWVLLFAQVLCGIVVYITLSRVFRLTAFTEMWQEGLKRVMSLKYNTTSDI